MSGWDDALYRLAEMEHWRQRHALAVELMEAFQTGQILECSPAVRKLLDNLASDEQKMVRKVIANDLALLGDDVFEDIAIGLCNDTNTFVKQAALRSFSSRRKYKQNQSRQESGHKRLSKLLGKIHRKYGDDVIREVQAASEARYNILAGSMAHDMRSILTHLKPSAKALINAIDSSQKDKVEKLATGLELIESCLADVERYTEPLPVERNPEDLHEILTMSCEIGRQNIEKLNYDSGKVTLNLDVQDGLRLQISRHLIIFAVANLVKNAYESFMEDRKLRPGEIFVEAQTIDDGVEIIIRDNGMGMSAEDLAELEVLVPCRRNKAKRKSTGFGVPIAHRYIQAHGGDCKYESQEDIGTTVRITLPRTYSCEDCNE